MEKQEHANAVKGLALMALRLDAAQRPDFLLNACADKRDLLNEVCSELSSTWDIGSAASTLTMAVFHPGKVVAGRFRIVRFIAQGGWDLSIRLTICNSADESP